MKIFLLSAVLAIFLFSCNFQNPESKTTKDNIGTVYGKPFDYSLYIAVSDFIPMVKKFPNDTVISGQIKSICDNGRCVTLATGDKVNFIVRWKKDFTLGNEIINKTILAAGHAYRDTAEQEQYIFEATGLVIY